MANPNGETPLSALSLPNDEYEVHAFEYEDYPGTMVLNGALRRIAGHSELPYRMGITLQLIDQSNDNGMPTEAESQLLDRMTALIEARLDELPRRCFLAVRITAQWMREWMLYIADHEAGAGIAAELEEAFPAYRVSSYVREDPNWEGFRFYAGY